ncbi:MAG: hypothetical protein KA369_06150 [Spirochaetes bacterium]|nr:hypothetical protein [Spirochaetota bacterium]
MRSFVTLTAALLLSLAGCVTMPDPVPVNYLVEKTPEQGKILEKLENGIIAKNHEVKALKDKSQAADQKVNVEKGRLGILKDERSLLDEKKKQYQMENDAAKTEDNNKQITAKDGEIKAQELKVESATASSGLARAQKEVGETELSVMVAELNYEKARIAREYLVKHQAANAADKKDQPSPDKYDDKYRLYLEKQREALVEKRNTRDEAALKLKIAEDKLKQ